MHRFYFLLLWLCACTTLHGIESQIQVGADRVMNAPYVSLLKGKKSGSSPITQLSMKKTFHDSAL
ncbi:hypothetical protein [Parachlamydia acanthamoebae]|uniref:Uncharacterized protein n=1 Tax=Parachlamydia acanthamoebae TaxID=83552 RepID=A0A0C1C5J7_9BACT|nr:hypothetical protein [Parachlamydia acanthamoebae]KIA76480.1 hypothetical protein DB43_AG00580 [Parachlamydia acanthamoebae]